MRCVKYLARGNVRTFVSLSANRFAKYNEESSNGTANVNLKFVSRDCIDVQSIVIKYIVCYIKTRV